MDATKRGRGRPRKDPNEKPVQHSLLLHPSVARAISEIARREEVSNAAVIRRFIRKGLEAEGVAA